MALELTLQQKLTQQLVMTPQLQQAIKLLQLNHLELADVLREELAENPTLEEPVESAGDDQFDTSLREEAGAGEGMESTAEGQERDSGDAMIEPLTGPDAEFAVDIAAAAAAAAEAAGDSTFDATPEPTSTEVEKDIDWEAYLDNYAYSLPATANHGPGEELPSFEASLTRPTSLHDHLRWQIRMQAFSPEEARIAGILIEEINEHGYMAEDAAETAAHELGLPQDTVEAVIDQIQRLDPLAVGARNLRECLLIQCQHRHPEAKLTLRIIDEHLHHVERRNYNAIAKALKVDLSEVGEAVGLIAGLEPRPGRAFADKEPQYITPDIYVTRVGDEWVILLNEDGLPKLRISGYYRNAMARSGGNTKSYLQERLRSAAWLIRSIHMRQRTIYRVMESILTFQADFFNKGVAHLKPLILKDVADDIGMHESTISRVTTNKYVHTPRGIYELKYFFNSSINRIGMDSIASESVRDQIKRLIEEEDPRKPYSDQKIADLLKVRDIDIARRTVAKYREMLRLPSSSKRKQVF